MILTVTVNSALDWVTFIDEFRPEAHINAQRMVESVGGKGFDVSVALNSLGIPSLALGIVAGSNGERMARLLDDYPIEHDLVWADGETRIANVITETLHHRHTHITILGYTVPPRALQEFVRRYRQHVESSSWTVIGGSMPPGLSEDLYRELISMANQYGSNTLIDCMGQPMLQAIQARPTIIKMNQSELTETFSISVSSVEDISHLANQIRSSEGLNAIIITLGDQGILGVTSEGTCLASCPPQKEVNAAGSGDAVSAALVWRLSQNDSWASALRWAAAAGAATALTEATAEFNLVDVERLYSITRTQQLG